MLPLVSIVSTGRAITTTRDTRLFALPWDVAWKVTVVVIRCGSCGLTDEPVSSWFVCGSSACDLGSYSDERCIRILNGLTGCSEIHTLVRDMLVTNGWETKSGKVASWGMG